MEATLKIRAGYDIAFNCFQEVPMLLMLSVHPSRQQAKALHSLNRSALMRMTGSDEAGIAIEKRRACLLHGFVTSRCGSCGLLRHDHEEMVIINRWRTFYGSSAVLKSPRDCTMLESSMRRVGLIDITGRQRDAPRRIATFHHATLRVAPHRYATLEPLGKPGGSRAFSADGLILGVVRFEVESPPLPEGKSVDEQRRRISTQRGRSAP